MRFLAKILACLAVLTAPAFAQTEAKDRGYIQAFLEDNLSGAGRDVRVIGFKGALSSQASIDKLTIADADGIWLTLEDAVLNWNRGALLRGRLEIAELSAAALTVSRLPSSTTSEEASGAFSITLPQLPSPETSPFSLPDLPVSIRVDQIEIGNVKLGTPVLGQEVDLSVKGSANLAEGEGLADLSVQRIGSILGEFAISSAFSNSSRNLRLALDLQEAPDGIVATLMGLPGRPSVTLTVSGDGPIEDFSADIGLATDGQDRLAGKISLTTDEGNTQRFSMNLGGDIRPLVQPNYHAFLGPDVRMVAGGRRPQEGGLMLDQLSLTTKSMRLMGALTTGPDGWPTFMDVSGSISGVGDAPLLLALPGPETKLKNADFQLRYDVSASDGWALDLDLTQLDRAGVLMDALALRGAGQLVPGNGDAAGKIGGLLSAKVVGFEHPDPALSKAAGSSFSGQFGFDYVEGDPIILRDIDLAGADYGLTGDAQISGAVASSDLTVTGALQLKAMQLARFAEVSQQAISGTAQIDLTGHVSVLDGGFNLNLSGETQALTIGIPQLDPLIAGTGVIGLSAVRDDAGTVLRRFSINTALAEVEAKANLTRETSSGVFDLRVRDTASLDPDMSGPAAISGQFTQSGDVFELTTNAKGPGDLTATLNGAANVTDGVIGALKGEAQLQANDLSPYRGFARRNLSGGVDMTAAGDVDLATGTFDGTVSATLQNLVTGSADADAILRGRSLLEATLRSERKGLIVVDNLSVKTPRASADVTGSYSASKSRLRYRFDLDDIGILTADLSGPLESDGVVASENGPWQIDSRLAGPGGTQANLTGQMAQDFATARLNIDGSAPLALANRFIQPNLAFGQLGFDLSLNGPLALNSVSGTLQTNDARMALASSGVSLEGIRATGRMSSGAIQIDVNANVASGGNFETSGRIGLTPPFRAQLATQLNAVAIEEPGIYETNVNGVVNVNGPLQGGAQIEGQLALGTVEIRIPDTINSAVTALPNITHRNEPSKVRQTRRKAGFVQKSSGGQGAAYPLDIRIDAPSRIFIRGRGLDAELGGALRLRGTTADVVPEGQFDLVRGRLDILGKRLDLTEATAQLQGNFDPFLRLVAETQTTDAAIQFVIEGLVSELEIAIQSVPELPEDEILSRLLFGRNLTQISPLQAIQIASAIRTLAGAGGDGVVERLRKNFGLDDLDVSTSETGETGVRLGKYITDNIYSDVTVDSAGNSEINLNLSITPSLTGRGSVGSDGNSGIGLLFERDY